MHVKAPTTMQQEDSASPVGPLSRSAARQITPFMARARSRLDAVKNLTGFDGLTATPGGKPAKRKRILTPEEESKKKEKEEKAAERRKKAMNGRMKHLDIAEACSAQGYESAAEIREYMDKRMEMDKEHKDLKAVLEVEKRMKKELIQLTALTEKSKMLYEHLASSCERTTAEMNMARGVLQNDQQHALATFKELEALKSANRKETANQIAVYKQASAEIIKEHLTFLKEQKAKPKDSQSVRVLRSEIDQLKATIVELEKAAKKAKGRKAGHDDQRHRRKVHKEMEKQQLSMHSASPKTKKQISGTGGGSSGPSGAQ